MKKFISICIPSYQKPKSLQRLLESIAAQSFNDIEVIISDDSQDGSVEKVITSFSNSPIEIKYIHNNPPHGMPGNWNHVLHLCNGKWIKMMHDDDWFASIDALAKFVSVIDKDTKMIFSAYKDVDLFSGNEKQIETNQKDLNASIKNPLRLYTKNIIGPPSTTLIHHSVLLDYDLRFRWRVDVEMYIRLLRKTQAITYLNQPLINIGRSDNQITATSKNNPVYEIPELYYLLEMYGKSLINEIVSYDTAWRMFRNTGIRNEEMLKKYLPHQTIPTVISQMLTHLNIVPKTLLQKGIISKSAMLFSYFLNRKNL